MLGGPGPRAGGVAGAGARRADWGEGERLAGEKESLGFFITGHPLERYQEELAAVGHRHHRASLPELGDREVTVGGIVAALRLIKTKKGDRMATFVLEDLEGGAEVLVFPETYKKVAGRLADDQVVLVKGKAEAAEEGPSRLLATEVLPLDQAKLAEARYVTIRVPLMGWDRGEGERLRDILGSHRGDCPVTLEMFRPGLVRGGRRPQHVLPRAARTRSCGTRWRPCSARAPWSSPAPTDRPRLGNEATDIRDTGTQKVI